MSTSRKRRGTAPILAAAAAVIAEVDLDTLLAGTVTTRRVANDAAVSPGTVSHHFPGASTGVGQVPLPRAAAEHALAHDRAQAVEMEDRVLDALDRFVRQDPDVVAQDLATALTHDAPTTARAVPSSDDADREAATVSRLLHAAVAPRDPRARRHLAELVDSLLEIRAGVFDAVISALDRRVTDGLTPADLALLILALREGLHLLDRHQPESSADTLYATGVLRLLEAFTEPDDHAAHIDALDSMLPLPRGEGLQDSERERVHRAATSLYDESGWDAVTIGRVARRAGVGRGALVSHFGDRHGLAAVIWARYLPQIEQAIVRARGGVDDRMQACLEAIAIAAADDLTLTSAFLNGVFAYTAEHGPPRPGDGADPRNLVPLPGVIDAMLAREPGALEAGWRAAEDRRDAASMLNNAVLLLSVTRPNLEPTEVARRVLTTTYAGMREG